MMLKILQRLLITSIFLNPISSLADPLKVTVEISLRDEISLKNPELTKTIRYQILLLDDQKEKIIQRLDLETLPGWKNSGWEECRLIGSRMLQESVSGSVGCKTKHNQTVMTNCNMWKNRGIPYDSENGNLMITIATAQDGSWGTALSFKLVCQ
jgi:hypothetical protein